MQRRLRLHYLCKKRLFGGLSRSKRRFLNTCGCSPRFSETARLLHSGRSQLSVSRDIWNFMPAKIAQPFMAGKKSVDFCKSRQRRKKRCPCASACRPSRDSFHIRRGIPSHQWLGYIQGTLLALILENGAAASLKTKPMREVTGCNENRAIRLFSAKLVASMMLPHYANARLGLDG